jgi:hypothetical protein
VDEEADVVVVDGVVVVEDGEVEVVLEVLRGAEVDCM